MPTVDGLASVGATIQVDGLSLRIGRRPILSDISFEVPDGIVAVLGRNGAGKTTLLRILATAIGPTSGSVRILDKDTRNAHQRDALRPRLGYLPQAVPIYPHFTVEEFVEYIGLLKGVPSNRIRAEVDRALHDVNLDDHRRTKLGQLSGGTLRRAGIAQAIVNDPAVLILDEPSAGLDPEQRSDLKGLLQRLRERRTVILSTHLAEDVAALADQVLVIDSGALRFDGSLGELARLGDSTATGADAVDAAFHALVGNDKPS